MSYMKLYVCDDCGKPTYDLILLRPISCDCGKTDSDDECDE